MNIRVHVCIDMEITPSLLEIKNTYNEISFYHFSPNPVGPYIIRNYLISHSKTDLIFYQDSDDIPCADRFETLAGYMNETGAQLCGSHELRLDYFNRTVRAFRFPKDVKAALAIKPGHPLLHPPQLLPGKHFIHVENYQRKELLEMTPNFCSIVSSS